MADWLQARNQQAQAEGWTRLDLGSAALTEIPAEVFTLQGLEVLLLGRWYYDDNGDWIESANQGQSNTIAEIPPARYQRWNLTTPTRSRVCNASTCFQPPGALPSSAVYSGPCALPPGILDMTPNNTTTAVLAQAKVRWRMILHILLESCLGFWLVLILVAWFWGCTFIYPTTHTPLEYVERYSHLPQWGLHKPTTAEGITLVGLRRTPRQAHATTAPWLMFWGGNAAEITSNAQTIDSCRQRFDWGIDIHAYRGYDGSTGTPREAGIVADARVLVGLLHREQGVLPSRLILIGQSLGSGVAVQVAAGLCQAGTPPASVILISPYRSIRAMFNKATWPFPVGWAAADTWRSDVYVNAITCPVLIIHGTVDTLIPLQQGRALAAQLGDKATFVEVPHAGHGDVWRTLAITAVHDFVRTHVPMSETTSGNGTGK